MSLISNHTPLTNSNVVELTQKGNKRSTLNKEIGTWAGDADTASVKPITYISLLESVLRKKV